MFFNSLCSQRIGTRDLIIGFDWNYKMYSGRFLYERSLYSWTKYNLSINNIVDVCVDNANRISSLSRDNDEISVSG